MKYEQPEFNKTVKWRIRMEGSGRSTWIAVVSKQVTSPIKEIVFAFPPIK